MKRLLLAMMLVCGVSYADTTANLVNNATWSGVGAYAPDPNDCCSNPAGSQPLYDTSTNTIKFSYGQATVQQGWAINQALQGTGIQVGGYNYSYDLRNLNGRGGQNGIDSLTVNTWLKNSAGQVILSTNNIYNTQFDWTTFSGTMSLTAPMAVSTLGTGGISFAGRDGGYWAGLYGPEVRNVSYSLNYTVDPCAANPRYSTSCAGYNSVWSTGDLTSIYGTTFAVQQALGFGNTGVRVHSAIWGYDYNIGGRWCNSSFLGICTDWQNSYVTGTATITNNTNTSTVASDTFTASGENISGTVRREFLLGSSSPDISTLGNANITMSTTGIASYSNTTLGFTFTPDICSTNPLVNSQCPGYAAAYLAQQCTISALYDPSCPGYAAAYYTQQCTLNALYDIGCPGYAVAYFNQQCSLDPLYATQCPGYDQAYFNKQCSLDGLYDKTCPNYAEAYAKKNLLTNVTTTMVASTDQASTISTGNSTVDAVVNTTTTSTTSPTATVQLTTQSTTTDPVVTSVETTSTETSSPAKTETTQSSSTTSDTKTTRQELAEKRQAAKQKAAAKAGKEAAEKMDSATSMEQQVAVQNVVIAAMGYTPGFNAYSYIMPDVVGYKPFAIYKKQKTVDNARLVRGLTGASDQLHQRMVDSQYKLGD